jgi:putative NADH-flavin reductase
MPVYVLSSGFVISSSFASVLSSAESEQKISTSHIYWHIVRDCLSNRVLWVCGAEGLSRVVRQRQRLQDPCRRRHPSM